MVPSRVNWSDKYENSATFLGCSEFPLIRPSPNSSDVHPTLYSTIQWGHYHNKRSATTLDVAMTTRHVLKYETGKSDNSKISLSSQEDTAVYESEATTGLHSPISRVTHVPNNSIDHISNDKMLQMITKLFDLTLYQHSDQILKSYKIFEW